MRESNSGKHATVVITSKSPTKYEIYLQRGRGAKKERFLVDECKSKRLAHESVNRLCIKQHPDGTTQVLDESIN